MLNRIILMGRLVADPELKYTSGGHAVCTFRIAVDRSFKNQQGEREADFISCKAWRQQAEFVSKYFTKGRMIALDGRLESSNYETQNGEKRTKYEVVCDTVHFVDKAPSSGGEPREQRPAPAQAQSAQTSESRRPAQESGPPDDFGSPPPEGGGDDDLPF